MGGAALGATALAYYMTRKNPPIDPLYDFDNQSIEIDVSFWFFLKEMNRRSLFALKFVQFLSKWNFYRIKY